MGEEVPLNHINIQPCSSLTNDQFILVHGASHGAWCWYKVRTILESFGHTVTCLDLKGSGLDRSDPDSILSFHEYNQPLIELLSSLPCQQKVILVGHSSGGISVTEAIHKFPDKIQAAVYVCATMLKLGFQSDKDAKDGIPDFSEYGQPLDFGFGLGVDLPPTSAIIKKELQRKIMYQMSPIEDCTLASMLLRPFPLALTTAKFTETEGSERVPRIYIKTLQDKLMKVEQQDAMIKRWTPSQVYTIDSDHSPNFSNPFLLSGLLAKVAASFSVK